ncbi:MAG: hypothetical protein AB7X49_22230, partial [Geminicoccaceae bacterium]
MATSTGLVTDRDHIGVPANGRRLAALALAPLLGGVLAHATPAWAGTLSPAATATSSLALRGPARTVTVTTAADRVDPGDGVLSLREAVAKANATAALDAIVFEPSLEGRTLVLTGGELVVSEDLSIDGDRDDDGSEVTLSGGDASRVLTIAGGGTDVALRDLTLTDGRASDDGGAVYLGGGSSLAMVGCTVRDSKSSINGYGGGIHAASNSRLTITGSRIVGNNGGNYGLGGGIDTASDVVLTIRDSQVFSNRSGYGGSAIRVRDGSSLSLEASTVSGNVGRDVDGNELGEALLLDSATATIAASTISDQVGRGISAFDSRVSLIDSTVAGNTASGFYGASGAGIHAYRSTIVVRNSTITGNRAQNAGGDAYSAQGGGIGDIGASVTLDIANSVVAGNSVAGFGSAAPDVFGTITRSDGHNVFGSVVTDSIAGDRTNVAAAALFAALDPSSGGGKLNAKGVVPLKRSAANPAASGGDPLAAGTSGQLGTTRRPLPAGSLPDIGSVEIDQPLSTGVTINNDVLIGSAAANHLVGLAGNDLIEGLGGDDRMGGGDGSDVLDGGPGDDLLNGGTGVDLASYAGTAAVAVDLGGRSGVGTARRGDETDRLTSIEGAIGSSKADSFKGDAGNNEFRGGLGKDRYTGGCGRDLYDLNAVAESPAGAGRDVITDFAPG